MRTVTTPCTSRNECSHTFNNITVHEQSEHSRFDYFHRRVEIPVGNDRSDLFLRESKLDRDFIKKQCSV